MPTRLHIYAYLSTEYVYAFPPIGYEVDYSTLLKIDQFCSILTRYGDSVLGTTMNCRTLHARCR